MEILFFRNQISHVLATCMTSELRKRWGQQAHRKCRLWNCTCLLCLTAVFISLLRTCLQADVTQMKNTSAAIQTTHLFLLSFRSALHLAETCLRLTQRHLCRKQAHLLANFSWFLFDFNYRITNILKPYQPTKLSRMTAETFQKRPGLQASFNSYYMVWMSIICTIFIKCFYLFS